MLENALEGSAGSGSSTAYSEAFRIIMRLGVSDKSFIVRLAAARCLKTFASTGGPGLGFTELENSIFHCTKALEDPVSSVRDAFAQALGSLLALAMNFEGQVKQRGKNQPVPARKPEESLQKHLISPFIRASGARAKYLRIGLALSWVFFLQVVRLKYHLPDSELQKISLQAMDLLQGNSNADAHALACVLYILRVGVTDQMTEPTQRSFLVLLGSKLESSDYNPLVGVATLRVLSYLLKTLGEVPAEFRDVLDNTVVAALSHSSLHVRIEAALTLRSLAEVDPTCVGGLISYGVTTLHALRESVSIEKGGNMGLQLDSLHGQATVLAALVFISPKLLLGYPARLPKSVFEVSKKMLTEFSRSPAAAAVEKDAGWLLLSSLIASMPKEELEDQVFDVLLLWADPYIGDPETHIRGTHDLTSEMRVMSAGIEALTAFIKSFIYPSVASTNCGILLQPVLAYLRGALHYISCLSVKPLQNVKPALDLFIIRTLMAYQSISDPMSYKSEHSQIMQICSTPFSDTSGGEESSCLRFLLDRRDACLGPWIPGRDWFEDELRAFDGGKDGLVPCVWEEELSSFPQPDTISKLLVNQKLLCFGTIFATQEDDMKLTLLSKIDQSLKNGKRLSSHVSNVTNACVALLAGLKAVLVLRSQTLGADVLNSIQSIFQSILAEGDISPAQRRASSEGLGLLARLGNDVFTARMTRFLLGELVTATDPSYIGSIALSLGCIHRSAGGMALSTLVPTTVSSISLLAKSSNASLQLWALHALLLTIEAADLSYVSQVQGTLFLAMEILLSEENGLIDLRQEIGRLINAIVAVLGPELAPGSTFFSRCKFVIAEISSCQEMSTLLESVRFTQQLVLFAPQAVSVHAHIQSLLPTLSSKQPSLRYLAVSTLRHLIEKDPVSLIHESIEENLFSMLNEETDSEIGGLVRTTITRLLHTSCPSRPSRWLALLHNMILSTSTRRNGSMKQGSSENTNASYEGDETVYYGDDDEDMIASHNGKQKHASGSGFGINSIREKHLRYRTRVFAAECLSYLPTAVGTDPAHSDLSLARKRATKGLTSSGDWLVLNLQELISLSYQISTGQFEGMRPIGVRLLILIVDKFGSIPDPDLPGHLLLEQYQAQFVSAVRSAVSMSCGPLLLEAGLQLATKILTGSIISGDRVALIRMFSLISHLLNDIKDLYYPSFAEWVACQIKVRLLAAHASIKCYVYHLIREEKGIPEEYRQLAPLLSNSSSILGKCWISVLKDYIYICFGLHLKFSYKPFLDGIQSPLVSSKVKICLEEAWLIILQATALDAAPANYEMDNTCNSNIEDSPKSAFQSGYTMVRLEFLDFQFIWGLAVLILFHGHQAVVGSQLKLPLIHRRKKHNGAAIFEEKTDIIEGHIFLPVFQSLSIEAFFSHQFLTLDLCTEFLQVLIFSEIKEDSWNGLIITLLSQIVHFCPDVFFEAEDFTAAATELYFKYLLIALHSNDAISEDDCYCKNLISKLSAIAESMACRFNQKKTGRMLVMAHMSIFYELFTRASTNLSLSNVTTFLQKIMPFLKKYFREEAVNGINDKSPLETVLGCWTSMLASVSEDSIKRIYILGNRISGSSKLLAEILTLCLEESVAAVRLLHETKHLRQKTDMDILLFTVIKCCTKCFKDTFNNTNIQVKTVGLYVLKSIAQRELTEGSHMKDHDFSLFFVGEFFENLFLLIQDTLKGIISRESVALVEECLRLLFLFITLSQASEYLQEIMMLLLEALLMVFSIPNERHLQEINDVKAIARRLLSHLVQIPSFAIHIKGIMLSMSASHRQQLQDMIRASVSHNQILTQTSVPVQSQPSNTEVRQLHAPSAIVANADRNVLQEKRDDLDNEDGDDDDDDDWDAFQSLPANNATDSLSDSHINILGSDPLRHGESSIAESGDQYEKDVHHHDLLLPKVSEGANDATNIETSTDKERFHLDGNEDEEPSNFQQSEDNDELEKLQDSYSPECDKMIEGKDNSCQQNNEILHSASAGKSSVVDTCDQHDLPVLKNFKDVNSALNVAISTESGRASPDRTEVEESSDPQHFHGKEFEGEENKQELSDFHQRPNDSSGELQDDLPAEGDLLGRGRK
ncbi:HEAT repeat-containing protein 5B [Iris pallida]|uniref:HEAT repeat-containing protein 5B n=1 Tax=Iris pallida TaxID=29817 RepID=A0AAX6HKA8_IRIPA|nr:HEAT repeat-containing protein 5B [Iris pallida]